MCGRKWSALIALALAATVVLAACQAAPAPTPAPSEPEVTEGYPDEIRIGMVSSMTGKGAFVGEIAWRAIELAQEHKPTCCGGRPIKVVLADDKTDKTEATIAMSRLIEVDNVHAVLGSPMSSQAIAQGEVSEKAGMPVLSPSASNQLVTVGKPHYFRACIIDPYAGEMIAKYAYEDVGAETAAILVDVQQDYCVGLANAFRDAFTDLTGDPKSILGIVSFQSGDTDFSTQLTLIKNMDPDVVYCPDYFPESVLILNQAYDLGLIPGKKFIGAEGWFQPEFVSMSEPGCYGASFPAAWHPDAFKTPVNERFIADYKAKYNESPNMTAVFNYDAYMLLVDAIERAGSVDREAITQALRDTEDWEGLMGKNRFDENNNPMKPIVFLTYVEGSNEPVFEKIVEPPS